MTKQGFLFQGTQERRQEQRSDWSRVGVERVQGPGERLGWRQEQSRREQTLRGAEETSPGSNSFVETKAPKEEVMRVEIGDVGDSQAVENFDCQNKACQF